MLRKFVLTAAAAGALGFAALATTPATAAPISAATALTGFQLESNVATVQHWRWGSRRHWRWGSWAPRWRGCVWVHTRAWSRWRCR